VKNSSLAMRSAAQVAKLPVNSSRHWCAVVTLVSAAVLCSASRADDWAPNLTTTATWESNATNADASADQIDSLRLNGDLVASQKYPFGRDDAVHATVHFGGEWWPRYNGLTSGAIGGRVEWRHQFGTDPLAPTVSVEGFADGVVAKDTGRRGGLFGAMFSARKRFNDATRGTLSHEVSWFDARYATYDRGASETAVEVERDVNSVTRFTLRGAFRDGDIVSYASGARPDLVALAPDRLDTELFGRTLTAHRIDARTWSARGAFIRALDDRSAVIVAYEWRKSTRTPLRVTDHLISVSLVYQF
jgi:hypothetical protein